MSWFDEPFLHVKDLSSDDIVIYFKRWYISIIKEINKIRKSISFDPVKTEVNEEDFSLCDVIYKEKDMYLYICKNEEKGDATIKYETEKIGTQCLIKYSYIKNGKVSKYYEKYINVGELDQDEFDKNCSLYKE